jgi:two-component system chemotaxis sensor kinase CheA
MDGFSLVAELRARPALAHLPAVLVTSRDAQADRDRGREVGAQGYIVKGRFDQGELLALIRRLTSRSDA